MKKKLINSKELWINKQQNQSVKQKNTTNWEKYLKEYETKWNIIKDVKEIKKNINETKRISQNNIEMLDFHNITQKNQKQELYKMNEQIKLL